MTANMRSYRWLLLAVAIVHLGAPVARAEECTTTSYGDGISLEQSSAAADILASPDDWAGRSVRIEGTVEEVCQQKGCWIEIVAHDAEQSLRVKVDDGVIVFPASARGRHAVAQGTVEIKEMTAEQWEGWQRHLVEERGGEFDPSAVADGPYRLVQISGTGAEICL